MGFTTYLPNQANSKLRYKTWQQTSRQGSVAERFEISQNFSRRAAARILKRFKYNVKLFEVRFCRCSLSFPDIFALAGLLICLDLAEVDRDSCCSWDNQ